MIDIAALQKRREKPFFGDWNGHISDERVQHSEQSMRQLIDDLIALEPSANEPAAREAVNACVRRFNALDDAWIMTIEREDICETIYRILDLAGFDGDEDWLEEREW